MIMRVDRDQVVAFRMATHNLSMRLPSASMVEAAGPSGVQETPTGSAALAFLARVDGMTPGELEQALRNERSLVSIWSVRGAPYVVPSTDVDVFSRGALPLDLASFKQTLGGWTGSLADAGLDPFDVLDQVAAAARELLDGRTMNVNELRDEIYARTPSLASVDRPSGAHADMPEPLFRALGTTGVACIVANRGTDAELARLDQWLSRTPGDAQDRDTARAELVRRFLHSYGPAPARQFAEWSQRSTADAKDAFTLIADELVEVTTDHGRAFVLEADQPLLAAPPEPVGVRLLPVQDPFLQQRDRSTLVSDDTNRRRLWQPVRGPGGVLIDGEICGVWPSRTKPPRLEVTIEPFRRLLRAEEGGIEAEAALIAPFRNCETVQVNYSDVPN